MKHTAAAKAKIGAASRARNSAAIATAANARKPKKACVVEGCGRKHEALGFCNMHYIRSRQTGDPGPAESQKTGTHTNAYGYLFVDGKPEHVAVAEKALGRKLPRGAIVHHVNEVRDDNAASNLVICPRRAYHNLIHARMRALAACGNANWMLCPFCGRHDDPSNLYVYPNRNAAKHRECYRSYKQQRLAGHAG